VRNASSQIGQVFGSPYSAPWCMPGVPHDTGVSGRFGPAVFVTGLHHAVWVSGLALLAAARLAGLLLTRRATGTSPPTTAATA
jgi:hypothetical protein